MALDLGCPFNDLEDLCVAHPLLHRVVAHDPGAPQHLDRIGGDPHGRVGGERLRVGAEQARILVSIDRGSRAPDEQARSLDQHRHVRELEADTLALEDRTAKRLSLPRVGDRVLDGRARDADRRRRDLRARGLEEVERDRQALALVPDAPVRGDAGRVEHERPGLRRAQADLAALLPGLRRLCSGDRPWRIRAGRQWA